MQRIAVIGAGPAGLACAQALRQAGLAPVLYEKSRGIGGRMAKRRRDDLQFDHGAQRIFATTPETRGWLDTAQAAGCAAPWPEGADALGTVPFVGLPGMSGLCRPLAEGLEIRFSTEVKRVSRAGSGWRVATDTDAEDFDLVATAIPAPQVLRIMRDVAPFDTVLPGVVMAPCWALMVSFGTPLNAAPIHEPPDGPFDLVLCDSAKPGRPAGAAWVAHASADWSRAHLEEERETIRDALLAALPDVLGPLPGISTASAHRWRFGLTETPLGADYLATVDGTLLAGGDWSLGATAGDGLRSGQAMAATLLARIGAPQPAA
ncbi:NAD(P)/FAD-dependent oxidoreductase [Thetidibacter halocola]|uniref:FAD-dependent oxidoreductase n=1 Tax=Thetidibacter halocola TaxID=2827239 RepID=A0A8J7WF12_9RHOB|nr:FAD-dependent oxidoreductase [Thetidibacter halocola]MBS0124196.1 FAD-dependent oxidoreductase [Thetidibacter halocola]